MLLENTGSLPRVPLANLPTPLERLENFSAEVGAAIWIKRDDLTGLATGGNKTRKLEFLIADALQQGADCVITAGGPQSNHCRQTAAAAAKHRLACHLVLGGEPQPPIGNLLLDHLLGATIHWVAKSARNSTMQSLASELAASGCRPYVIPIGGSNAVGAVGYAIAFHEVAQQLEQAGIHIDRVLFPTSSGGTQAGLVLGARMAGFTGRITAISVDVAPGDDAFLEEVADIATRAARLLGSDLVVDADELDIDCNYLGGGYGVVGDLERDAIRTMARTEGILVGPVYSGRGVGAMLHMLESGTLGRDEKILYWHTGDESALHAYASDLNL